MLFFLAFGSLDMDKERPKTPPPRPPSKYTASPDATTYHDSEFCKGRYRSTGQSWGKLSFEEVRTKNLAPCRQCIPQNQE